ncbi:hypothetical protein [Marinibactrum halimedae]|uniref:Uncharacterized protein n=1 Tax=Marinibactrum halimedae TaxID=1444977 RepID=A0AA37WKR8_9GAMM|nr:hypothetical protein [Marinibactrum halimedae]MCD9459758.1 hypothetical protein [Marinibactrum halimedae]GLS24485.1 hypothetical protein GCM10007877_01970 [Marinibactrum halimedae]
MGYSKSNVNHHGISFLSTAFVQLVISISLLVPLHVAASVPVGVGLTRLADFSGSQPFVNIMKQSRPWIYKRRENGRWVNVKESPSLSEFGYPTMLGDNEFVMTRFFSNLDGHYRSGKYRFTYKGEAKFRWDGDAKVIKTKPGEVWLEIAAPKQGFGLSISHVKVGAPLSDMDLRHETELDSKEVFTQPFIEGLSPFEIIRFMDWQRTNNSSVSTWNQRTPKQYYTQALPKGVALEYQIDLANQLDVSGWFVIPHLADDDYVEKFAKLLNAEYRSSKPLFIEYTNEGWNSFFKQSKHLCGIGASKKLSKNPKQACARAYSERAVEVLNLVKKHLKPEIKLVRVISGMAVSPTRTKNILEWKDAFKHVDAFAIAPYFGGTNHWKPVTKREEQSLKKSMNQVTAQYPLPHVLKNTASFIRNIEKELKAQKAITDQYKLKLITYEAGQHLVAYGGGKSVEATNKTFHAANRHPQMYDIYQDYLSVWEKVVGNEIVMYNYVEKSNRFGSWGLGEYDGHLCDYPKYRAVADYIDPIAGVCSGQQAKSPK